MSDTLRRVFISYARTDSATFVDRLERDLKAQQFHPWVDRHGLEGGQEWMEIIQQAIDECHALVVVLSPGAVQSKFVRIEYRYADELGKLVIPLRYLPTPTTPMDLRILQWVDFQSSYDEGLRHLVQALSRIKIPATPPTPPRPQPQPPLVPAKPPKTKEQWFYEGDALYIAKRYTEALAAFDQASKLDPHYANAHLARGNSLTELQHYTEALTAYAQALQLDSQNVLIYNGRGNALWYLKRPSEALAAYDQAIKLDPQFAHAYLGRGNALRGLKRYEEALASYDQAIRLDPHNGIFPNNKALLLDELGRKQEAEQARQKARDLGYTG